MNNTTHDHFASRDIDPTCDLCRLAQTFRPLATPAAPAHTHGWAPDARCVACVGPELDELDPEPELTKDQLARQLVDQLVELAWPMGSVKLASQAALCDRLTATLLAEMRAAGVIR